MAKTDPNPQPDEFCLVSIMLPMLSDDKLAQLRAIINTLSDNIGPCRYEIKLTGNKINGGGLDNQRTSPSPT